MDLAQNQYHDACTEMLHILDSVEVPIMQLDEVSQDTAVALITPMQFRRPLANFVTLLLYLAILINAVDASVLVQVQKLSEESSTTAYAGGAQGASFTARYSCPFFFPHRCQGRKTSFYGRGKKMAF